MRLAPFVFAAGCMLGLGTLALSPAVAQQAAPGAAAQGASQPPFAQPPFAQPSAPANPSFFRHVLPILMKRCSGCHRPESRSGKLNVTTYAALKSGGIAGPAFVTGRPADSPLYKQVSGKNPPMPKDGKPLSAQEVETIRLWIEKGGRDDTPQPRDPISQAHPYVYPVAPDVTALAYSPDGSLMAVSGFREILLHKADGSGLIARLVGRSERIESLAFSPDGKTLAAAGGTNCRFGELQLWDVEKRQQIKSVEVGFDALYGVSFSTDGSMVACGSAEKSVYLFKVPTGEQLIKFDNHSDWVFGTTFTRDGKNVVSTSRDRAIKMLEIATKNFVDDVNYQVYNGGYFAIAREPARDNVAVGGEEGIVRVYSIYKKSARTMNREDYNLLRTYQKMPDQIASLAYSADAGLLAAGDRIGNVWVYRGGTLGERVKLRREALGLTEEQAAQQVNIGDPQIMDASQRLKNAEQRIRDLEAGKLDEGGLQLGQRDALQAWLQDGEPIAKLRGVSGAAHSLAWNPQKNQLAVGTSDGSIRLFDLPSGQLVKSFVPVPLGNKLATIGVTH
jgi:WD40 repeat protein